MTVSLLRLRVIVYDWDDPEEIKNKILDLLKGIDLKKEKVEIKETKGKGLLSTELIVYELELRKEYLIKTFLKNLFSNLTKNDIDLLLEKANFDEDYRVYLRVDKLDLLNKNKVTIVDHGDVFHIVLSFDIPKKSKELIIKKLKDLILN